MKTRIVLAVVFVWSFWKSLEVLVRSASVDQLLFEGSGQAWLFWAFLLPLVVLQAGAVVFTLRPALVVPYRMAQAAVALGMLETVVASFLGLGNPGLLKSAIVASRTERGLPIRPELLSVVENPLAQLFPVVVSVILGCVWFFLLLRVRRAATSTAPAA